MSGYEQKLKRKSNPDFDRLQKLKKRPTQSTAKGNTILSRNPRFLEKRVTRSWHTKFWMLRAAVEQYDETNKTINFQMYVVTDK